MTAKRRTFYRDGREIPEEDAVDEAEIIRDGVSMHCPVYLTDAAGHVLTDAAGAPLDPRGRKGRVRLRR